jgi:hypothetical protein
MYFENPEVGNFVDSMHNVPRKALKCDLYDTVNVVVDEQSADKLLCTVFPGISTHDLYNAKVVMQDQIARRMGT